MKIQKMTSTGQLKSWHSRGCFTSPQNVQRLAENLTHELAGSDTITQHNLSTWLQHSVTLGAFLHHVFNHLYRISHREKDRLLSTGSGGGGGGGASASASASVGTSSSGTSTTGTVLHHYPPCIDETEHMDRDRSLIPYCRGLDLIPSYPSLLDLNQIVFINSHLPAAYQYEWRFLFSSEIHGESFSTLIGRIVGQGPSVLVLEDRNGYMFGGFAPASWSLGPRYYGDDSSFLFTLSPRMRMFESTGYNDHYMYLNLHQQTMPNGLVSIIQHLLLVID